MPVLKNEGPEGPFPVIELFGPTIQGEGALCGHRSHFIRFGGCSYRCTWCDSMHAVEPAQVNKNAEWLTPKEIAKKTFDLDKAPYVTLTGGDPVLWDLEHVVEELHRDGIQVAVETQGAMYRDWLRNVDVITVSPKGPSSGMEDRLDYNILRQYADIQADSNVKVYFKVVCFGPEDFEFAKEIHRRFLDVKMYLSSGTPIIQQTVDHKILAICMNLQDLAEYTLKDKAMADVVVLPQLHALIWPEATKGR